MATAYPHILVTGAPRSGTTFLGRTLSLPRHIIYVFEPFNPDIGIVGMEHAFTYLEDMPDHDEEKYKVLISELLAGHARFKVNPWRDANPPLAKRVGRRLFTSGTQLRYRLDSASPFKHRYLIKDPMASFASEYLHRNLGFQTVVVVRHPAATIASYKRLGWRFALSSLTSQPKLMSRYLYPVLGDVKIASLSAIEEWSYLWLATYTVLDAFLRQNPEMIMVRHEDMSLSPVSTFEQLYKKLQLDFTPRVKQRIIRDTSSANTQEPPAKVAHVLRRNSERTVSSWRALLSPLEISTVERITRPLAHKYYPSDHWWH